MKSASKPKLDMIDGYYASHMFEYNIFCLQSIFKNVSLSQYSVIKAEILSILKS